MRQVKSEKTNGIGSEQADNEKKNRKCREYMICSFLLAFLGYSSDKT